MDKFWAWFKRKYLIESVILEGVQTGIGIIPEQMLIGYMIEYLNENKFSYNLFSLSAGYCYQYLKSLIECLNEIQARDKKNKKNA